MFEGHVSNRKPRVPVPVLEDPRTDPRHHRKRPLGKDPWFTDGLDQLAARLEGVRVLSSLRALGLLRLRLEHVERVLLVRARDEKWSWDLIAHALGVSRQAVQMKHKRIAETIARRIPLC